MELQRLWARLWMDGAAAGISAAPEMQKAG
jgi:hypothetical protein